MPTVRGSFVVELKPQAETPGVSDPMIGRMSLDKKFHGELEGVSKGMMLGVHTAVKGSAGYVAMERFEGMLAGKRGSFVLQHSSTMSRGAAEQSIAVVPDSGTGELEGLSGTMVIEVEAGRHGYVFEYVL